MNAAAPAARLSHRAAAWLAHRIERVAGGRARTLVVVVFACVLALESADLATIGAAAPELRHALHISNTELGLLAAVSTLVGALVTVPAGALADRLRRVDLLAGAILLWGAAMVASAFAQSYGWLLACRIGLGALTAAAGPTVASLTGDFFPGAERAKIYGYILSGELLGTGIGFVVSGSVAAALSWRWAFAVLVIPAALLAVFIRRRLPEPARGGQSWLAPGSERIAGADEARGNGGRRAPEAQAPRRETVAQRAVQEHGVEPLERQILRAAPVRMKLREAVRYVLSIRTNRWLIAASAVGYFFFAGLRTFALVFTRGDFSLGPAGGTAVLFLVGVGSLAGVLVAGRLADNLLRSGRITARVVVGATGYLLASALLLPGLLVTSLAIALPLLFLAAAGLSAPNPPLDAARLDIMPSALWGRAEGVRTLLRQTAQAGAPVLFGLIADAFGGGATPTGGGGSVSPASTSALRYTFLLMLMPLALNGLVLLGARSRYPADVATAIASERVRDGRS